jgi:hypothetical protein
VFARPGNAPQRQVLALVLRPNFSRQYNLRYKPTFWICVAIPVGRPIWGMLLRLPRRLVEPRDHPTIESGRLKSSSGGEIADVVQDMRLRRRCQRLQLRRAPPPARQSPPLSPIPIRAPPGRRSCGLRFGTSHADSSGLPPAFYRAVVGGDHAKQHPDCASAHIAASAERQTHHCAPARSSASHVNRCDRFS